MLFWMLVEGVFFFFYVVNVQLLCKGKWQVRYVKSTCYLPGCWNNIPSQKEVFFFPQGNRLESTKMLCSCKLLSCVILYNSTNLNAITISDKKNRLN
jgi:hypothetical protein